MIRWLRRSLGISNAIGQATRVIMAKLAQMEKDMTSKLDDLLDSVEKQQTKIDSLIALTNGLHDQVITAMGDTITPSQKDRIDRVFQEVADESAKVDAALTANTAAATAGAVSDGSSAAQIKTDTGTTPAP